MAKKRQITSSQVLIRPGEGTLLDVLPETEPTPAGSTSITFAVQLGSAPVPDRKYVADVCTVLYSPNGFRLLFGQERLGGKELRSLVVIHMAAAGVARLIKSFENMKQPSLAELVETLAVQPESLSTMPQEPDQTVALSANMTLGAIAGREACLDFYQASPFSIVAVRKAKKLGLDPVVRIDVRTTLLLGLLDELRKLVSELPDSERQGE